MNLIDSNIAKLKTACLQNRVSQLYAFGSVLTDEFSPDSDVDLVVDFDESDPLAYGELYFNLKFELEAILGRKVDLLEAKAIRNSTLRQSIDKSKRLVYERRSQSVA